MDETKFDWADDGDGTLSARYGSLFFMVTPHADDQWTARVSVKGVAIYDESFDGRDAAIRWCGRRLPEIVDPLVATVRAEAALAEREALVFYIDRALRDALGGVFRTAYVLAVADAIRARTTPATLSTETLAAIAEARGLRVVEPELLAGLEPPVLRWGYTAAHESEAKVSGWHLTAADRNWALIHESGVKVLSPRPNRASETDNRRAAEAALRSLGVAFRVEDGGAL